MFEDIVKQNQTAGGEYALVNYGQLYNSSLLVTMAQYCARFTDRTKKITINS